MAEISVWGLKNCQILELKQLGNDSCRYNLNYKLQSGAIVKVESCGRCLRKRTKLGEECQDSLTCRSEEGLVRLIKLKVKARK